MEEYIFIIIAIVLSIFGAINKNKKKEGADEKQISGSSGQPNSFFKHFLDEDFFEQPVSQPASVYKSVKMPVSKPKLRIPSQPKPFLSGESRTRRIKDRISPFKKTEFIQKGTTRLKPKISREIMNGFSIKKAVVYSEILKTKY